SGVFHQGVVNIIANSVAFDAEVFFEELQMLESRNVPKTHIKVSMRAQLLLPFHKMQDMLEEQRLGSHSFGSTQSGIAPFYSDKYAKTNIQISELYSENLFEKAERIYNDKSIYFKAFYNTDIDISKEAFYAYLIEVREKLKPYLCDCAYYINNALKLNKMILFEGQLGSLRDIDNGIYPFVTSSSPLAAFGAVSTGVPPYAIKSIVSVVKSYSTCVGAGPFVGELIGEEAELLRNNGGDNGEYGAKTGRPRRMGWFDCVATRYGCMLQGTTEVALSLLDVLGYLDEIPISVGYRINGKMITEFPETHMLDKAEPIYEYLKGWKCDISDITEYEKLPIEAKDYVDFIEKQLNLPVTLVSNGPKREQVLYRNSKLSV
ncbi:MAG: adenylosuccinate synthetase, partial [Eubacterium sp.]|nr:adenylosuccinate synthetase [Eubacterium sp.]